MHRDVQAAEARPVFRVGSDFMRVRLAQHFSPDAGPVMQLRFHTRSYADGKRGA